MKNAIATLAVFIGIGTLGTQASAAPVHFTGIDTTITQHGFATVLYKGQTYHLTEGDKLGNVTVVLIDAVDHQVIVKKHNHLKEIRFAK